MTDRVKRLAWGDKMTLKGKSRDQGDKIVQCLLFCQFGHSHLCLVLLFEWLDNF